MYQVLQRVYTDYIGNGLFRTHGATCPLVSWRKGALSPLRRLACELLSVKDRSFAADGLPEISELLRYHVCQGAIGARPLGWEDLPKRDPRMPSYFAIVRLLWMRTSGFQPV